MERRGGREGVSHQHRSVNGLRDGDVTLGSEPARWAISAVKGADMDLSR